MKTNQNFLRKTLTIVPVFAVIAAMVILSSCGGSGGRKSGELDTISGLKDFYKDYFPIGVAVSPRTLEGAQGELVKKHFNSLTAENVMKPALIQPEEGKFYWEDADKIVDFAMANGMKVRGHTLVWHNQTGEWMYKDAQGNQVSKEVALARLKEHITQVVTRYKGKIYAWDVLNEAIVDGDSTDVYRQSEWFKICGEEFIAKIFQWAHEADPDAVLFYNDYNTESPVKREKIYNMVKGLLDAGVPVHAVGLQGHWKLNDPSEQAIRESIDKFSSLGLAVQITELDVNVNTSRQDTVSSYTPEREQIQTDYYKMVFNVFREKKDAITGVTFWNLCDGRSWLDRGGRQAYPLLFDVNLKPKKAYWEVVNF